MKQSDLIAPDWPAPANVQTIVTTRMGGVSAEPYDSLNVALHVADDPLAVTTNRQSVMDGTQSELQWQWLNQVHGNVVHSINAAQADLTGDGLTTQEQGLVCCIMTADCLPVLLCNEQGTEVAAAHGGWRGLANSVLANTIEAMDSEPASILAWLGPAIGPDRFEVGEEVRDSFLDQDDSSEMAEQFLATGNGKYLANLYGIARRQLQSLGIKAIYGGDFCTFEESHRFFSYRRDGVTGRQLSAIYLQA